MRDEVSNESKGSRTSRVLKLGRYLRHREVEKAIGFDDCDIGCF